MPRYTVESNSMGHYVAKDGLFFGAARTLAQAELDRAKYEEFDSLMEKRETLRANEAVEAI